MLLKEDIPEAILQTISMLGANSLVCVEKMLRVIVDASYVEASVDV